MKARIGFIVLLLGGFLVSAQEKYNVPKPQKPDVLFIVHAGSLVETEVAEAQESKNKDDIIYTVKGATSPAKTPMAEPILIMESSKVSPDRLSLFRMDIKNGQRQLTIRPQGKRGKNDAKPIFLMVNRLKGNLYKVEVNEFLENGEYCLSPEGSNQVFCFTTYSLRSDSTVFFCC